MFRKRVTATSLIVLAMGMQLARAHSPPEEARVFIVVPADGAVVASPVLVKMDIEGFGIAPAGTKGKRRHTAGPQRDQADQGACRQRQLSLPGRARLDARAHRK